MTQYDNRGSLWPNRNRDKPTSPHFKGEATINGMDYWVNAWLNIHPEGKRPPLTCTFNAKENQGDQIQGRDSMDAMDAMKQLAGGESLAEKAEKDAKKDFDDDIPF